MAQRYNKDIVKRITDMIREDTYSQREICKAVGLDPTTYGRWKNKHPDFVDAIRKAEDDRMNKMVVEARRSLLKKVQGYEVKEHKTKTVPGTDGKPKVKEQMNITKHIEPDTTAIIFVLTNGDPEHFKNRYTNEITGKDGEDLFRNQTDEELDKNIREMQRKLDITEDTDVGKGKEGLSGPDK